MKLGKIFICINILVLSLLMLKWPRIIYQNTSYRFDEYNTTIQLKHYIRRSWVTTWFLIGCFRNSKTKMVFEILMAWENKFVKIFTLFPEIHAPVLSHFITLKHYS